MLRPHGRSSCNWYLHILIPLRRAFSDRLLTTEALGQMQRGLTLAVTTYQSLLCLKPNLPPHISGYHGTESSRHPK